MLGFIAGTGIHACHEHVWMPGIAWLVWIAAAAVSLVLVRAHRAGRAAALIAFAVLLGLARYDMAMSALPDTARIPIGAELRFEGRVSEEPRKTMKSTVLTMDRTFFVGDSVASDLHTASLADRSAAQEVRLTVPLGPAAHISSSHEAAGDFNSDSGSRDIPIDRKMQVVTKSHIKYSYGDTLAWSCIPERVEQEPGLGFDDYYFVRGIGWHCYARDGPHILSAGRNTGIKGLLAELKQNMRRVTDKLMPEPESSFVLGLLLGDRQGLTDDMKESFRQTGTSHILAVSGYNVTKLVLIVVVLFVILGMRRRAAAVASGVTIVLFVILVGADPSVVRAGCMGLTGLAATLCRRAYSGVNALLLAGALMVAANPFILRHDIGFQLSFLAVLGLHAFGRPLERWFRMVPRTLGLRQVCAETTAATVATLPLTMYVFGLLAPAALPVNMVVLPLIPFAMLAGAVSIALGSIHPVLGLFPAFITAATLSLIGRVIETAAWAAPAYTLEMPFVGAVLMYFWLGVSWFAVTCARRIPVRVFLIRLRLSIRKRYAARS